MTAARRWWRLPAVVALVAGAVLLAVESHALATSRAANEREAVRSLLVISGSKPHGASEVIGTREQALLGLDGMPALRSALDAIATKRSAKSGRARGRAEREAEQILYGLVRSDAPAATRSQAANLLGVLVLRESLQSGSAAGLKKAAGLFRRAIDLAPESESAKFNLELVLSLPKSSNRSKAAKKAGAGTGSGTDAAGSGY